MPAFDEQELRGHIAANRIGALSLDTSVFDRYECNLDSQALLGLSQFRGAHTRFVLSEVVASEVKAHIAAAAADSHARLKAALRQVRKGWRRSVDNAAVNQLLGLEQTPAEFAQTFFAAFIEKVAPEIINVEGLVSHADVLRRYFEREAPFSDREIKKNEFPDALALLSLEAWATRNDTIVLVVSRDGDWQSFAASSEKLICVDDLAAALDYFNREARFVATRAVHLLREGEAPELHNEIDRALELFLESFDPDIEAHAALEYEIDFLDPTLQYWELNPDVAPKVLKADEDNVVFSVAVNAIVNFEATFRYLVFDGIDRDYVDLGSESKAVEQTLRVPLVIAIGREIDPEPVVHQIDITPPRITVDFGSVDPDWGYEE